MKISDTLPFLQQPPPPSPSPPPISPTPPFLWEKPEPLPVLRTFNKLKSPSL